MHTVYFVQYTTETSSSLNEMLYTLHEPEKMQVVSVTAGLATDELQLEKTVRIGFLSEKDRKEFIEKRAIAGKTYEQNMEGFLPEPQLILLLHK